MVGKQEYEIAMVSKYKEAKKAVGDDLVLPSDFNYLALKANALLDELLEYFKEEIEKSGGLFLWAESINMDTIQVI